MNQLPLPVRLLNLAGKTASSIGWQPVDLDLDGLLTEEGSAEFRPELSIKDGNHLNARGSAIVAAEVERRLRETQ